MKDHESNEGPGRGSQKSRGYGFIRVVLSLENHQLD